MALSISKEQFTNSYQTIFSKVTVSMDVCNSDLRANLEFGASVVRPRAIIDGVRVRDYTKGTNYTIDPVSDVKETLDVNRSKIAVVRIDRTEKVQMKNLTPSEFFGMEIALKVAAYVDGDALALSRSFNTFDAGNVGGTAGQPIDLDTAGNVEKTLAKAAGTVRAQIKGRQLESLVYVTDSLAVASIEIVLMGKQFDLAESVWKNGFAGPVRSAQLYVSENLSANADITFNTQPTAAQTFVISGFTYTFVAAIGATPGNVLIGGSAAATRANLVAALNQGAGAGTTYVAWTDAHPDYFASVWADLRLTAVDDASTKLTIATTGSGRLAITTNATGAVVNFNLINTPFMVRGAIDLVVQDQVEGEAIPDPYQMADIVRSFVLYGVKMFTASIKRGVNVKVKA